MAEMLIQSESLVAIADKIRVLSGTEEAMGLDAMVTHVGEANTNVDTEAELIAQISSVLEGKAGSGGSGGSVETVSYKHSTIPDPNAEIYYIDGTLALQHETVIRNGVYNIAKGTIFVLTNSTITPFGTELCGSGICRAILADG